MKANPKFDALTARWWKLTGKHVVELFAMTDVESWLEHQCEAFGASRVVQLK